MRKMKLSSTGAESEKTNVEQVEKSPLETFSAWWDSAIPNSDLSRDTARYNRLYELKQKFLSALSG